MNLQRWHQHRNETALAPRLIPRLLEEKAERNDARPQRRFTEHSLPDAQPDHIDTKDLRESQAIVAFGHYDPRSPETDITLGHSKHFGEPSGRKFSPLHRHVESCGEGAPQSAVIDGASQMFV
jgi:hypothetical protein